MNGRVAKKIRKYSKRNFLEYVQAVKQWPLSARWRLCWHILFKKNEEEQERINVDLKFLSSMASAASGVPVDFVRLADELEGSETKAVGLRKLWDEVKAEKVR